MTDFKPLVDQARYAEDSIQRERKDGSILAKARYSGVRAVNLRSGAGATMFAVSVPRSDGLPGVTDIMFCRTPELAKFVAMLLSAGEEIVIEALKKEPQGLTDDPPEKF